VYGTNYTGSMWVLNNLFTGGFPDVVIRYSIQGIVNWVGTKGTTLAMCIVNWVGTKGTTLAMCTGSLIIGFVGAIYLLFQQWIGTELDNGTELDDHLGR